MKRFRTGLIVGKFSPLHKGHEFLINFARENCENLYVFTYSKPEFSGCESDKRGYWLRSLFPDVESFVITPELAAKFGLELPHNDDADEVQRNFVARMWQFLVNQPLNAVFTSESYGKGFARSLNEFFGRRALNGKIEHVLVDFDRKEFPVSGTAVRADPHRLKHFLSPVVYGSFIKRICFLGAESTGKSTITKLLGAKYGTSCVEEYGRTLWTEKGGLLVFEDLLKIAVTHIQNEETAATRAFRFLFIDTSPLTTLLYSYELFGRADSKLEELSRREYDRVFLCQPDFPLVQDGTRQNEEFRQKQHQQYLVELSQRGIDAVPLSGDLDSRVSIVANKLAEFE